MIFTKRTLVLCAALFGLATSANAAVYKTSEMEFNVRDVTIYGNSWDYDYSHHDLMNGDVLQVDAPLTLTMDLSNAEFGKEYTIALFSYYGAITVEGNLAKEPIHFVNKDGGVNYTWTAVTPIYLDEYETHGYVVKVKASPIPEPSTATLGLLGLGSLMLRRRRK